MAEKMSKCKVDISELNQMLRDRWDKIACEYYSDAHRTSRNFDKVIGTYLPDYLRRLPEHGIFLDLGGGGVDYKIAMSSEAIVVVGDISSNMLRIRQKNARGSPLIQLSAFQMPFQDRAFDGVISILGDSFALPEGFKEIWRILKPGGALIIALPSKLWASHLRPGIGIPLDRTMFSTSTNGILVIPSFLYSESELEGHLVNSGFLEVEVRSFSAKEVLTESELSAHIRISSNNSDIPALDLPVVTIAHVLRSNEEESSENLESG